MFLPLERHSNVDGLDGNPAATRKVPAVRPPEAQTEQGNRTLLFRKPLPLLCLLDVRLTPAADWAGEETRCQAEYPRSPPVAMIMFGPEKSFL